MNVKTTNTEIKNSAPEPQLGVQVGNENINNEVNNMTDEEYIEDPLEYLFGFCDKCPDKRECDIQTDDECLACIKECYRNVKTKYRAYVEVFCRGCITDETIRTCAVDRHFDCRKQCIEGFINNITQKEEYLIQCYDTELLDEDQNWYEVLLI